MTWQRWCLFVLQKGRFRLIPNILQTVAMAILVGFQHWAVNAFPFYMSISYSQPIVFIMLELAGSHKVDMLSRDLTEGSGSVHCFNCSLFKRYGDIPPFVLNKGVVLICEHTPYLVWFTALLAWPHSDQCGLVNTNLTWSASTVLLARNLVISMRIMLMRNIRFTWNKDNHI